MDYYIENIYIKNVFTFTVLTDFITPKQLETGQLSRKEISNSSIFKKYIKGDPTCRLYIKNLSKKVTEKDLKFVYGLYVAFYF